MRTLRTVSTLDGASDLLTSLAERGPHLVLASSPESDLVDELLDRIAARAGVDVVVSGSYAVWDGPRDLLDQLGDSLLARWPAFAARV